MKHFRLVFLVVIMFISCMSTSVNAQSRYDVNSDGSVNISDAVLVVNKILHGNGNENDSMEAIDLGLPSGTKWASCNLGASSPEESGGRYAWGETEEKLVYSHETYVHRDWSTGKNRNIGNDISGTVYDAAHVKLGGWWHMPSQEEYEELVNYCTYEWTTLNGVQGGKFTGPNGKSIFLRGERTYWLGYDDGGGIIYGYYGDQSCWNANCMTILEEGVYGVIYGEDYGFRENGFMIRPVNSNISKTKMVDLGLPSGIKWASCNVGASTPEETGDKYAWGETGTKLEYTWDNYLYFDYLKHVTEDDGYSWDEVVCRNIGSDIGGTKYDVAHVKWGSNWRMPTKDEFDELFSFCTRNGNLYTGPNGNSIILPLTTDYWTSTLFTEYSDDNYTDAYRFFSWSDYGEDFLGLMEDSRCEGHAVRPVYSPSPTITSGKRVDLGLPSGTKWASCNVGASKPEEYGGYYAWGETEEKEIYNWSTYTHCDGSYNTCHDIGNISGTKYDVARTKLGGSWQIPTNDQIKELYFCCIVDWITLNGVNGWKFTSKINGNSIFLPAAGYRENSRLTSVGESGFYWSGTLYTEYNHVARYLNPGYDGWNDWNTYSRYSGFTIRPVSIY